MFMSGIAPWPKQATYRVADEFFRTLFRPAVAVDQWLFPRRWQEWTCPDELIDTVEYTREAWTCVADTPQLKPKWDRLQQAIEASSDAYIKLQLMNVDASSIDAAEVRKEIKLRVQEALDAERKFKRAALSERPGH
jgi:hypothetical protein